MRGKKFIVFNLIVLTTIYFSGCQENNDPISPNYKQSGLKIEVPADVNGKVLKEMIGVNITKHINDIKGNNVTSGGLEDQYLIDDFNNDGVADVAVRRGNLLIIDTNRDGVADHAFYFGNGNSERGYYTTNGGIAIVRGNSIFIDDNLDGITDRSFTFGNGNNDAEYIFMKPSGVAVRRADASSVANHIIVDINMDGYADSDFYWGNGNNESQYLHGFYSLSGWGLRRDYIWHLYGTSNTYSYGLGNNEDGYFLGKFPGNSSYNTVAVLRGNTFYYDNNMDGSHNGTFSFGTGLK